MKTRFLSLLPASAILIAGFLILRYQRQEIADLESYAQASAGVSSMKTTAPSAVTPSIVATPSGAPQIDKLSDDARAAAFIEKLREQLQPLVEKANRESVQQMAGLKVDRASLLLGLKPAEAEALRNFLKQRPANSLASATREWIAQNRGEEAAAKYDAAESARHTAIVEHDAQDAIFRLSRIVDLTPDQKDRLYSSFVRKASAAAPSGPVPSELSFSFSVQDVPAIGNAAALARSLLTPEQIALQDASRTQVIKASMDAERQINEQFFPAIISALESTGKE